MIPSFVPVAAGTALRNKGGELAGKRRALNRMVNIAGTGFALQPGASTFAKASVDTVEGQPTPRRKDPVV